MHEIEIRVHIFEARKDSVDIFWGAYYEDRRFHTRILHKKLRFLNIENNQYYKFLRNKNKI